MRTTQFIGLTERAREFVKDAIILPSTNVTYGMFDEEISLGMWEKNGFHFVEVVQTEMWSSGPMIFTHLRWINPQQNNADYGYCFSWITNPALMGGAEYDPKHGEYCI